MKRLRHVLLLAILAAAMAPPVAAEEPRQVTVWRSPTCGCCIKWVRHLEANGFAVDVKNVSDVGPLKRARGVPRGLASCHTAVVDGYVVEGHVPAADVARLLEDRPPVLGLAVPGMPIGSPGMEGPNPETYDVIAFGADGSLEVFATHGP